MLIENFKQDKGNVGINSRAILISPVHQNKFAHILSQSKSIRRQTSHHFFSQINFHLRDCNRTTDVSGLSLINKNAPSTSLIFRHAHNFI